MEDSLRSVAGWFVVILLLLLRKANRVKEAWTLLVPLVALYLALATAERQLNAYLIFHLHQYICSGLADLLRYFALSVAIVLPYLLFFPFILLGVYSPLYRDRLARAFGLTRLARELMVEAEPSADAH